MDRIVLQRGNHATLEEGACAMEWTAWAAGEPHSDKPRCVSPFIASVCRAHNDWLDDDLRQALIPVLLDVIGTNTGQDDDLVRKLMYCNFYYRELMPVLYRLHGAIVAAERFESIPPITNVSEARSLNVLLWGFHIFGRKEREVALPYLCRIIRRMAAVGRKVDVDVVEERVQVIREACAIGG